MNALTIFGVGSVGALLLTHMYERRSHWLTLGFAGASVCAAVYAFLIDAWLFGVLGILLYLVAMRRWIDMQERAR